MLAALALAFFSQTLTVDDDGPADFTDIQAAIDAAAGGSVILVEPGFYSAFTLTKRLTIAGRDGFKPRVDGNTVIDGAAGFTLVGLRFRNATGPALLEVTDVTGRGRIDDCILVPNAGFVPGLLVNRADELVVTRTKIDGGPAISVRDSVAAFVDVEAIGDSGQELTEPGANAFQVVDSQLVLTDGTLWGGAGAPGGIFICYGGNGGAGLSMFGSEVTVAGTRLFGGSGAGCDNDGPDLFADSTSTVYNAGICGCDVGGPVDEPPAAPLPRLLIGGSDVPGEIRELSLFGPAGELAVVALSLTPEAQDLPGLGSFLWLRGGTQLVKTLVFTEQTSEHAAKHDFVVPDMPSLGGTVLHAQAFFPGLPGTGSSEGILVSNPSNLIVRPQ